MGKFTIELDEDAARLLVQMAEFAAKSAKVKHGISYFDGDLEVKGLDIPALTACPFGGNAPFEEILGANLPLMISLGYGPAAIQVVERELGREKVTGVDREREAQRALAELCEPAVQLSAALAPLKLHFSAVGQTSK